MKNTTRRLLGSSAIAALIITGCGSSSDTPTIAAGQASDAPASIEEGTAGVRLVSAQDGARIAENPPEDLVILDVRTPEEFAEGHLDGAVMIDFYRDDFADQLAGLDPDVPYLLYCRSGNRSGQTATILEQLGFADVADIDGGILAWTQDGQPTVTG